MPPKCPDTPVSAMDAPCPYGLPVVNFLRVLTVQGLGTSKLPRLVTVKAVHNPVAVYMDPSLCWQGSSTPSSERGQTPSKQGGV